MKRHKGQFRLLVATVVVAFSLICLSALTVSAQDFGKAEDFVGKAVPAFKAKDLDGNEINIASFKGKNVVLINFWGLRCGSCIDEMPHLNDMYDDLKDKGLVILGINADGIDGEFLKGPRGMVKLPMQLKYTILQDPGMKLIDLFKMEAAPLNILIDKNGIVQYYHMGYEEGDEKKLKAKVESVL